MSHCCWTARRRSWRMMRKNSPKTAMSVRRKAVVEWQISLRLWNHRFIRKQTNIRSCRTFLMTSKSTHQKHILPIPIFQHSALMWDHSPAGKMNSATVFLHFLQTTPSDRRLWVQAELTSLLGQVIQAVSLTEISDYKLFQQLLEILMCYQTSWQTNPTFLSRIVMLTRFKIRNHWTSRWAREDNSTILEIRQIFIPLPAWETIVCSVIRVLQIHRLHLHRETGKLYLFNQFVL